MAGSPVGAAVVPAFEVDAFPVIDWVAGFPIGAIIGLAIGAVTALALGVPADLTTCKAADLIFLGDSDPSFGVTDDSAFDIASEEEIVSDGNGNENIRTSNLKKKDKNIKRTAETI